MGYCSQLSSLLLLLLLVNSSWQLDCSNKKKTFNDKDGDFVVKLESNETSPKTCQYYIDVSGMFRMTTVSVSYPRLTGSNKITVSQYPNFARPTNWVVDSKDINETVREIQMMPMGFFITFDIPNNTEQDSFEIMVAFDTIEDYEEVPYKAYKKGANIESTQIPGHGLMVSTPANKFRYAMVVWVLVSLPDIDELRNVYVYAMDKYSGTIADFVLHPKPFTFVGNNFKFLNRNKEPVRGFMIELTEDKWWDEMEVKPRTIENRQLVPEWKH